MVKVKITLFLLLAVAAATIKAAAISDSANSNEKSNHLIVRFYWFSVNSAGNAPSRQDCKNSNANLVQLDTERDLTEFKEFLDFTDQIVSLVWVGAEYTEQNGSPTFTWDNGHAINSTLWENGSGQPALPIFGVAARIDGPVIKLTILPKTTEIRFVCVLDTNPPCHD